MFPFNVKKIKRKLFSKSVKQLSGIPVKQQATSAVMGNTHTLSGAAGAHVTAKTHTPRERERRAHTKRHRQTKKRKHRWIKKDRQPDMRRKQQDVESNKELQREKRPRKEEAASHLTLAHGLFFLGFYLLVQGFPSKQRLQHGTVWDPPLLL